MSKLKTIFGRDHRLADHGDVCLCCGMTYRVAEKAPKSPPKSSGRGIAVYEGAFGESKMAYKVERTIVQTKNGPLTVLVRFKE